MGRRSGNLRYFSVIVSSTAPATPTPTPGGLTATKPWWEQLFGPE